MKHLSWSEQKAELHRLRREGKTPEEIAVILNRSESAIHRILSLEKKNGIVHQRLRHKALKYDKECVGKWRAMWKEGMTQRKIAEIENVNKVIVSIKLRQELYGELVY